MLNGLPKLPWTIPDYEFVLREDLRNTSVCSVDPPGCTDIDDALHYKPLPNGNCQVKTLKNFSNLWNIQEICLVLSESDYPLSNSINVTFATQAEILRPC